MSGLLHDGQEDMPAGEKKGSQNAHIKTFEVNNAICQSKKYLMICTYEILARSPSRSKHPSYRQRVQTGNDTH